MRSIKCVVVGDGAVGKTCLLISYTTNTFPQDYIPTVFDNYSTTIMYEDTVFKLNLWDTAGQEEYDRLRPLSYPQTDVFLCCFSVMDPTSFKNISEKWNPELCHHTNPLDQIPVILVGTKCDLRDDVHEQDRLRDSGLEPVSKTQAYKLCKDLGWYTYVECSSATQENVIKVFETAVEAVVTPRKVVKATPARTPVVPNTVIPQEPVVEQRKKKKCSIL